jgi:hypothetical protein
MRALGILLLTATLLLAGCASKPSTNGTSSPPPAPVAPAMREDKLSLSASYTALAVTCPPAPAGGSFTFGNPPTPVEAKGETTDKAVQATFTWTPVNPTVAKIAVTIHAADGGVLATESGSSPLTLKVDHKQWDPAGGPKLSFEASPVVCENGAAAASSTDQAVDVALAWNPS